MTALRRALVAAALAALPSAAYATPDARASAEIDALLAFVERSPCTFVRAGAGYDGPAARKHLERKYAYARSRLSTADQFVEHVASGSSLSGEAYRVVCAGREETARAWLAAELARLRAQEGHGRPPEPPRRQ